MRRVLLDPDGTTSLGLLLLVHHPTGVCYETQAAGVATEQRSAQGFLVPLATRDAAHEGADLLAPLARFFHAHRLCGSSRPLTEAQAEELAALVGAIPCWTEQDSRAHLELDRGRLHECAEAWVPVRSPYGPALLLFDNCD